MDETLRRRLVGLFTLALAAFLLSWLLPRPGLERLLGARERVVTIDLTRPDAAPQERANVAQEETAPAPVPKVQEAPATAPSPDRAPPRAVNPAAPAPAPAPPAPKPEPAKPVEKPAPPVTLRPPAPPPASGAKVMVQAGAYSHLDKAQGVRARAASGGVSCAIAPAETAKGTLYRLRCGPYADRAAAEGAVRTLGAAGIAAQVVGAGG